MRRQREHLGSIIFVSLSIFSVNSKPHTQPPGLENQNQFQIHIHKTEAIKIDGKLTEEVWKAAEIATKLSNQVPTDVGFPKRQTEFRLYL